MQGVWCCAASILLKSDLRGIETRLMCQFEPTIASALKSDLRGIETLHAPGSRHSVFAVKIRP